MIQKFKVVLQRIETYTVDVLAVDEADAKLQLDGNETEFIKHINADEEHFEALAIIKEE